MIELLVVVAIIAVLVAILLPALASARESAEMASCASGLKQTVTGAFMYGMDNNEVVLPSYWRFGQVTVDAAWGPYAGSADGTWPRAIYPRYCPNAWVFSCPSMKAADLKHPSNDPNSPYYPYHWWSGSVYGIDGRAGWDAFRRRSQIERHSETLYFCDSIYSPHGEPWEAYTVLYPHQYGPTWDPPGLPRQVPHIRHRGRCQVGLVDSHVEAVDGPRIVELGWNEWYDGSRVAGPRWEDGW